MNTQLKSTLLLTATVGLCLLVADQEALAQARDFWGNPKPNRFNPYQQTPNLFYLRALAVIASGAFGFGLGWFCSPHAKTVRKYIAIGFASLVCLVAVFHNGALGWGLVPFLSFAAFCAGFGYWVRGVAKRLTEKPTSFGSAEWANDKDIVSQKLASHDGFRLGRYMLDDGRYYPLAYNGDRHMMTIAPNRSGKGTTAIVPNLLTYQGSVMVVDPKGENAMITAKHRKAMGQNVHVVDPWGITGVDTARFNPMDWLVKGDVDIGENSMLLADAIIMMESKSEPFFDNSAKAALDGFILYVATDDQEDGQRNLGRVRDLLMFDEDNLTKLFQRMVKSPHHKVRSTGASLLNKDAKLLSNILASIQAQTNFLDSARIRDSLSESDFTFGDLKTKPTSIYLVLPSDRLDAYGRWLRLLIQQALTVNARNIDQKPEKSVLFVLDEMPALGRLTMVEQAFGLMAGYGMQIWGICQDASQLKRIYGDGWETFISNAGVIQYFGSRDKMTAEYFSALCGVTTVWNMSTAVARAFGRTSGTSPSSSSTTTKTDTTSGSQRKLAYPDELMRMADAKQLLLVGNGNPIIATKTPWFKDDALKTLGVNLQEPKPS